MRVPCFVIPAVPIRRFFKTGVGVCMIFHVFPFTVGSIKQVGPVRFCYTPNVHWLSGCLGSRVSNGGPERTEKLLGGV